jgi:hypothetical protein
MLKILNAFNLFSRAFDNTHSYYNSLDVAPIILLGPPRSNSTFIHRLMSAHTDIITPSLKELVFPGKHGAFLRRLLSSIPQAKINTVYNPKIHSTGANLAEADDIALLSAFSEGVFAWAYKGALSGKERPTLNPQKHLPYLKWLYFYLSEKSQNKVILSKYFAGVHHYSDLKKHFPKAKFVLLSRDPESVCYSLSTLLSSAINARNIYPEKPDEYWRKIYQFIVVTYENIENIIKTSDSSVLVLFDQEIKSNLDQAINQICNHCGLSINSGSILHHKIEAYMSKGAYQKAYSYSSVMDSHFKKEDFAPYYNREITGTKKRVLGFLDGCEQRSAFGLLSPIKNGPTCQRKLDPLSSARP